jgi:NifU-like protein involved in Fe-S cluster formation
MQIVIIAVALVVMAVIGYFFLGTAPAQQVTENTNPTPVVVESNTNVNENTAANANVNASSYKNGTFTQKGVYNSPAGSESVTVSVTLENGVVTNATFKGDATNKASSIIKVNSLLGSREW